MHTIEFGESFVFLTPPSTSPTTATKHRHNALYKNQARMPSIPTNLCAKRRKDEPLSFADSTTQEELQEDTSSKFSPGSASYKVELDHKLLTKDEEFELGTKIRKFIDSKKGIEQIIVDRKIKQRKLENARRRGKEAEDRKRRRNQAREMVYAESLYEKDSDDLSMEEELEEFLMTKSLHSNSRRSIEDLYGEFDEEDDEEAMMGKLGMAIYGVDSYGNEEDFFDALAGVDSSEYSDGGGDSNFSSLPGESSQLADSLDNVRLLTEREIKEQLGIKGGRIELAKILVQGALAKQELIRSNFRLVTGIAKKWMATSKGSGLSYINSGEGKLGRRAEAGDWSTPSLEEVVQQGIVGLAQAAERFEPDRNYKFSTYATYYITNEVRQVFQSATTQCLYVPPYYYTIKGKYEKIVRDHFRKTGGDPRKALSVDTIAGMLKLKTDRLRFILKSTQSLVQLDAPIGSGTQPGKAGGNDASDTRVPLLDILPCDDFGPERIVEQSLLRQCLENALAAELLPLERDIVRLRHGLDDGKSRTHREVIESCGGMLNIGDVRALEDRAYKKLRFKHSVHNARLREFAADYIGVAPEMLEAVY